MLILMVDRESYTGYTGLADPADMMACNAAQLYASDTGHEQCAQAAQYCMQYPGTRGCREKTDACTKGCSPDVAQRMQACSHICGPLDYFPSNHCGASQVEPPAYDYGGEPGWKDFCSGAGCVDWIDASLKANPGALATGSSCE